MKRWWYGAQEVEPIMMGKGGKAFLVRTVGTACVETFWVRARDLSLKEPENDHR